ncbi:MULTISPECIES: cytochrome P450 [Mycobacterium]|uniref:cytochrome P450 n=1 Tax=Mycobacterium TaxID=1763 RepID=UPI00025D5343|nr:MULTISPECIES: cytochrome P450 [Mycobacterium]AFJ34383.1 cytochrome P450 [Mycobacterium sp. MOTT36Y]ELR84293.1 cytochrome P450 [Mycobacterium sp. H4Y]PBA54812.1 cytochrome P450 [Mycobacterium intracellulare subsp. chimaera]
MTVALEFDPFSEDFFNGAYETYRRMREEAPVYYSERYDFYALSRHVDVAAAYKNFETYSSARGVDLAAVRSEEPMGHKSIIMVDPPEHRHMRGLVNKVFTPRAIEAMRPLVTGLVDRYLDATDPAGFDVVQDFSALFPVEVITTMLGVPEEDRQQIRLWLDTFLHREPGEVEMSEAGVQAATQMAIAYYQLVKERRAAPRDDMISALVAARVERENGELTALDNIEIAQFAVLLGGAGAETVTKLVANAVVLFARHPEQWQKLLDDRSKVPAAVEEVLRYESPNQYNVRCSREDVTLHGVTIPAGKPVFLLLGSANRDPDAWTKPEVFDIERDRTEAQNLGFGYGIHSCLGAALARMESSVALQKLLDHMPHYEVDWAGCRRVNMQNVAGWNNVPVRVLP